ncbi:3-isopropylmalate dehydratase, small subunit [Peptoniphilus sp. ING2-D1G]|nr:3-isopropylmalate dehydratase, small subunit [Peptoniphilus sp. ING2-D1G]
MNKIKSTAISMLRDNIDTDIIIPKNFLKTTKSTGFGDVVFYPWRYDEEGEAREEFPLNKFKDKGAQILIAGDNFGCGSSREHAAWALQDYGFRVVIAGGYSPIFYMNWINNLNLPIILNEKSRKELASLGTDEEIIVDLEKNQIEAGDKIYEFQIEKGFREKLLKGQDSIDEILEYEDEIENYEREHNI